MSEYGKPVTLGRLTVRENGEIKDAQQKAGRSSDFIDGVPSLRVLVMALIRAYNDGRVEIR